MTVFINQLEHKFLRTDLRVYTILALGNGHDHPCQPSEEE